MVMKRFLLFCLATMLAFACSGEKEDPAAPQRGGTPNDPNELTVTGDLARFPQELKDAIGMGKFILMDNYRMIEKFWPVHII